MIVVGKTMNTCKYMLIKTLDGDFYKCYVAQKSTGVVREFSKITWCPVSPKFKSEEECYNWAYKNGYKITGRL